MGFYPIEHFAYGYFVGDNDHNKITDQNNVEKISSSYLFHIKFEPVLKKVNTRNTYQVNAEKFKTYMDQTVDEDGNIEHEVLRRYISENSILKQPILSDFATFICRSMREGVKSFKKEEIINDIVSLKDYDSLESVEAKFKELETELGIENRCEPKWYVIRTVMCTL